MTEPRSPEDLQRDLELIASRLPSMPSPYDQLRSLLARLQGPLAPKIVSAGGGEIVPGEEAGAKGLVSALSGTPPGFESAAGIGVFPVAIPYNLLADPAFEGLSIAPVNLTGADAAISSALVAATGTVVSCWTARTVSGAFTTAQAVRANTRFSDDPTGDPTGNSHTLLMRLRASAAGTNEIIVHSRLIAPPQARGAYLVGAVRFIGWNSGGVAAANRKIIVELYNATVGAVRASQTFTGDVASDGAGKLLVAGINPPLAEENDQWYFRFRVQVIAGAAMGSDAIAWFVEPRLAWMPILQAPAYAPAIAGWAPQQVAMTSPSGGTDKVLTTRLWGDTQPRIEIDADGTVKRSSGAATADVRERRGVGGNLVIDSNGQAATTWLQLQSTAGQGSVLSLGVAGDTSERTAIWGDAAFAGLEFGPGNAVRDTNAYRRAADLLATDDRLAVGGNRGIGTMLARDSAHFWIESKSLIAIGDSSAGSANPRVSFFRTTSGFESGAGVRIGMPSSIRGLVVEISSGIDVAYGSETWTERYEFERTGALLFSAEIADPGNTAANQGRLYIRDNGGKTQLAIVFASGAVQVIATEP